MEFQAVIMAAGRGIRMGCLTTGTPKALLPLGHHPLLYYPAKLLEKWGFEEAILIVPDSHAALFSTAVAQLGLSLKFDIVQISEEEDLGTADALRIIAPKIKTDVLVLSCDLITDVGLQAFANKHRRHDSAATVLLAPKSLAFAEMDESKIKGASGQQLIIGLEKDENLLCSLVDEVDLEGEGIALDMDLLRKHPRIRLHHNLYDGHMYLLKKWVIDYVAANTLLKSIQGDLMPSLVESQFRAPHQPTPPSSSGNCTPTTTTRVLRGAEARGDATVSPSGTDVYQFVPQSSWIDCVQALPTSMPGKEDPVKKFSCYAYLLEQGHCVRANTLALYTELGKAFSHKKGSLALDAAANVHPSVTMKEKSQACSESMIDADCSIGERCSIKKSMISKHCNIGDKVRITNSIIMDHVTINGSCNLHNTVVCPNAYINEQSTLTNCQVGKRRTVAANTQAKNEEMRSERSNF